MKIIVVLMILGILFALGSAMFSLIRSKDSSKRTVKALTLRISLSVALFLFLMLSYRLGWIQPHGVY
ncbi:twin transmembrane helix small protein [Chitinimonas viridis]|uniref:Twin transmembrane helix small protein n=2 Tax=Chitinimonas TaxID=240411 RepID=A0ABT8B4Y0_9NEIS|nr:MULTISPECIES: twin transmembrane helix small protein [Chitinimonas]MBL8508788.1 twin transmembrane helix small protein [Chitinimonas sp.]MDN3576554.1 twin transmembrane helix small protein [Chitinimonas viridis]GLR11491.1 membrane protein [Chitinimonas prasina]